jgi:hypothetical protein
VHAGIGAAGAVPALEVLRLCERAAGPEGVPRLAEGLGAGALPAVTWLVISSMHLSDAGASALAAEAPCRGSRASLWATPPSATRGWWPSRRPCGGGPR